MEKILKRVSLILILYISFFFNQYSQALESTYQGYAPQTYNYTPTNFANIVANSVAQYTNPSSSGSSSDSGQSSGKVQYAKLHFTSVKPSFNDFLNGNWTKKCFINDWTISEVSSSTAFVPLIKVKQKLLIFCVGAEGSLTLNGYGQCGFIGLVRVCARITPPCTNGNDTCCNSNSNYSNVIASMNNYKSSHSCPPDNDICPGCKAEQNYRVCAFEDPMFPGDLTDTKSGSMPFHYQTSVPPDVTGGDQIAVLGAFIFATGLLIPGLGLGAMMIGAGLMLAGGIMELIEFITSKMNYAVIFNHGCVDVPLTPFPPPYCTSIPGFTPSPEVISLAAQSPDYVNNPLAPGYDNYVYSQSVSTTPSYPAQTEIATQDSVVERGFYNNKALYSTFDNPVVRIFFRNTLPECTGSKPTDSTPASANVCVYAYNLDDPLKIWYNSYNLIPICNSPSDSNNKNCIYFPSKLQTNVSFRPYYNMTNTDGLGISGGSTTDLGFAVLTTYPSWLQSIAPSLKFAGINFSNYVDASPGNIVTIQDFTGVNRNFVVYLNNDGDQVCVAERFSNSTLGIFIGNGTNADVPIKCVNRPTMMDKPAIATCNTTGTNNCQYAGSLTTTPCYGSATCPASTSLGKITSKPRMMFSVGSSSADYKSGPRTGIIQVDTEVVDTSSGTHATYYPPSFSCISDDISSSSEVPSESRDCSLYGLQVFSAYVTDIYNRNVSDNSSPNITPNYSSTNLYGAGAQFANGAYCRGASQICLNGYIDQSKKVVAKAIFKGTSGSPSSVTASNITSDRVIPPYNSASPNQVLTQFFNPSTNYQYNTSAVDKKVAIGSYDSTFGFIENLNCTNEPSTKTCIADGTPTENSSVPTTCYCKGDNYQCSDGKCQTTPTTSGPYAGMYQCSNSGCDKAFLKTTYNPSISYGYLQNGSYMVNDICTTSSDYTCSAPCLADGTCNNPFTPTQIKCTCKSNCNTNCSDLLTSSGKCTITGCEYAFSTPATTNNSTFYVDSNGRTYPISGSSACPDLYYTSNGGNTCNGSNCPCYILRPANSVELGLCAPIPQPSCPAISHVNTAQSGAGNDGYANWPATSLGDSNINVTGTCISGANKKNNLNPTRSCTYIDNGYEQVITTSGKTANGCPKYTIGWGPVTNPCVAYPSWWPGQFLYGISKYQGAIFNHFGVNYYYRNSFVPKQRNTEAFYNVVKDWSPSTDVPPDPWLNSNEYYNSCKSYNPSSDMSLSRTPRTTTNGDQEMLYLTQANWNYLWTNYDLNWLFASSTNLPQNHTLSDYNGCYVYDLNGNVNATVDSTVKVGMKICKYNSKISFSLVDLNADTRTDYRNNAYIMQSNIIAYEAYTTQSLTSSNQGTRDGTFDPKTTIYNNVSPSQLYNHPIYHGIVVDTSANGFSSADAPTPGDPPFATSISTAESVNVKYSFTGYYFYDTSNGNYFYDTVYPYPYSTSNGGYIGSSQKESLENYIARIPNGVLPTYNTPLTNQCALHAYRTNVNYSSSITTSTFFPIPLDIDGPNNNDAKEDDTSNTYLSRLYVQTQYDGGNKDNGRRQTRCGMYVTIDNYVSGNSAMNPQMFLWNGPNDYKLCNQ